MNRASYSGSEPLKKGRQIVSEIDAAAGASPEGIC